MFKVYKQLVFYRKLMCVVLDNTLHYFTSNVGQTTWLIIICKLFFLILFNEVMMKSLNASSNMTEEE